MVSTITGAGTGPQDLCLVNCSGILDKLAEISQEELSQVSPLGDKSSPTLVRYQKWACAAGLHLQQKKAHKKGNGNGRKGAGCSTDAGIEGQRNLAQGRGAIRRKRCLRFGFCVSPRIVSLGPP